MWLFWKENLVVISHIAFGIQTKTVFFFGTAKATHSST
jgi:hypothetical protein